MTRNGNATELVERNVGLCWAIAKRWHWRYPTLDLDDIAHEGIPGLFKAAEKWDGIRPFATYACYWIEDAIRKGLCHNWNLVRIPMNKVQLASKYFRSGQTFAEFTADFSETRRDNLRRALHAIEINRYPQPE